MTKIPISLSDLRQDIAGSIPVSIIENWNRSKQTQTEHDNILQPFLISGVSVVSDSAGLSKLSLQLPLFDVLAEVSKPKEIIYNYGYAIGGRGIGVWAADNTQMFYPAHVPVKKILSAMQQAQENINNLLVKVGIGIHSGTFYAIGDGLFGKDADYIEHITENYSQAGDILLSETAANTLDNILLQKRSIKTDIVMYSAIEKILEPLSVTNISERYPIPFDQDFYALFKESDEQKRNKRLNEYTKDQYILLLTISHDHSPFILDTLSDWTAANVIISKIAQKYAIQKIKSNGSLAIFTSNSIKELISMAEIMYKTIQSIGLSCSIGISKGECYVFPLGDNQFEIAGNPVNIASKIAEDCGLEGIIIHESAIDDSFNTKGYKEFTLQKSSVELKGIYTS